MNPKLIELTGDADIAEQLETYFSIVDERHQGRDDLDLLTMVESIELTEEFRTFQPIVRDLQGVILDDPGTSDHHVLLCRVPFDGAVLHLTHDGESRVVFNSIESFLEAAHRASGIGGYVEEEHPEHAWIADDQATLKNLIASLRSEPDGEDILPALIPSLELSDVDFLSALVTGKGFYVAEAVCREIAARPTPHLLSVAKLGEEHSHSMVRTAAAKARERIAR